MKATAAVFAGQDRKDRCVGGMENHRQYDRKHGVEVDEIVNGEEAGRKETPWMVSLFKLHLASTFVVAPSFLNTVVTAAHCKS